jgi:hypothetical protein
MGETSYKKALHLLSADKHKQEMFKEKLTEWRKVSPQIVENFEREHFLPEEEMKELMKFIIDNGAPIDKSESKKDMRNKIYANYQLKGGKIEVSLKRVGFAIPKARYTEFLIKQDYKRFGNDNQISDFLENIQKPDAKTNIEELYSDCLNYIFKEKEFLLWVTWDDKGDNLFPFLPSTDDNKYPDPDKSTRQKVKETLGLVYDKKEDNESEMLLFFVDVDTLEDNGSPLFFRPTFCDADFVEFFRPTPIDFNKHGLTWPVGKSYSDEEHPKKGRPEAVVRSKHIVLGTIDRMILLNR